MRKQRCRSASRFFVVTAKLISAFVFATEIVHFLFFLNPKFQASSLLLCLYSSVCVRPVRKPHCWFSHEAAQMLFDRLDKINVFYSKYQPHHEKTNILHMPKQRQSAKLISAFVFVTRIVHFFNFLNSKFPAPCHLLYLYSLVCVIPVQKPHCWFSHDAAQL